MKFGAHVSIAGGINKAPGRAHKLGCECFQFFSRSPRGGKAPELKDELVESFLNECSKYNITDYYIHTPYYINLCSEKKELRESSIAIIREELQRGSLLGVKYIMTHLGSSKDISREKALNLIIEGVKKIMYNSDFSTKLLLENTAGQGATVGDSFEELSIILDELKELDIGICLDTAHTFAAGYDIKQKKGFKETLNIISDTVGIEKIKLFHGNDSKVGLGERKDRHEHIGKGKIGLEGFKNIIDDLSFENINMIVETPPDKVDEDIKTLKKLRDK
ncbi:deoxyribonuclease IV [Ruegeria sp.]|uniref:deoxyribonuclease IV n=1 Tax=Ruegeria sp. TaxID=1879320 RepID=UPI00231E4AB9|nr:deoxyribonuclease IV [Ruegeria sp.]MDA7967201.1 deoxyribonuclease IV [Ruegeria sp.]